MPEFANPFSGITPERKLTLNELTRAIRLNIAAELEAVHLYEAHADATDNELARKVLLDVADEERVHAGEFQKLLSLLLDDEDKLLSEGRQEVEEMLDEINAAASNSNTEKKTIPTIGNLRD